MLYCCGNFSRPQCCALRQAIGATQVWQAGKGGGRDGTIASSNASRAVFYGGSCRSGWSDPNYLNVNL